jgi:cytochrome c-type biogenesis protein CcmE
VTRLRILVAVAVIAVSLGWVAARGLTGGLVYYQTPTEVLSAGTETGERIRLGGLVAPGSVRHEPDGAIRFIITDGTSRLSVLNSAAVPALFTEGKGVVVEGVYGRDGAFHADTVLVQHEDSYRPPSPGETPHSADLESG